MQYSERNENLMKNDKDFLLPNKNHIANASLLRIDALQKEYPTIEKLEWTKAEGTKQDEEKWKKRRKEKNRGTKRKEKKRKEKTEMMIKPMVR